MHSVSVPSETVGKFHHGGTQSLRLSQHPWSQRGPPRRPQSLRIMAWVGAEPEGADELVVEVVVEHEALLEFVAEPETVVDFMVWVVPKPETVGKLMVSYPLEPSADLTVPISLAPRALLRAAAPLRRRWPLNRWLDPDGSVAMCCELKRRSCGCGLAS